MMTDRNKLGAVPDQSMRSLFAGLVEFLGQEARLRGWKDVSERLAAVEAALSGKGPAEPPPH